MATESQFLIRGGGGGFRMRGAKNPSFFHAFLNCRDGVQSVFLTSEPSENLSSEVE